VTAQLQLAVLYLMLRRRAPPGCAFSPDRVHPSNEEHFMPRHHRLTTVAAGLLATLAVAVPAAAHQTVSSNGATVTVHVSPDDAPVAGHASSINVLRIRVPKGATFALSRATVTVRDSSGRTVLSRRAAKRIAFTFPRPVAYEITVSGSYRRAGKTKRFAAAFAIRANAS
jgi:hypothetical protein